MKRFLHGVPTLTLSEVLDNYLSLSENVNRNHYLRFLTSCKWVYKDMLLDTIWSTRKQVLTLSSDKTVKLPCESRGLISLSIVDSCGNVKPLFYNADLNTLKVLSHKNLCSCDACGGSDDTLCCEMDNISYTDEVKLMTIDNGAPASYRLRTYIVRGSGGQINREVEVYGPQTVNNVGGTNGNLVRKYTEPVCELETDDCGCIAKTTENVAKVTKELACHLPVKCTEPGPYNQYGRFTFDESIGNLIHVSGEDITQVIATYRVDGEISDAGEYVLPEYAVMAFLSGLDYIANKFVTSVPRTEKREKDRIYSRDKKKLRIDMNPISLEEFLEFDTMVKLW